MRKLMFVTSLLSIFACVSAPTSAELRHNPSEEQQIIDENIIGWLSQHDVPAAAVAYIEDGTLSWTGVYGDQSPGKRADQDTLFNIASMTKAIAAETILRAATDGKIMLDEPMSAYWIDPDIINDPRHARLTPEIALRHRTGFPNWRSPDDGLTFMFEPGERGGYSGEGYDYVARFAEKKLRTNFAELTQKYVFDPLNMESSSFVYRDWFKGRISTPKGPDGEIGKPDIRDEWSAADDIHTTVGDYAKFMISVMKGEDVSPEITGNRFAITDNLFAKGCPWGPDSCPVEANFAMGWAVFSYEDETVVVQGGGDWGERTIGFFIPERNAGLIVFTNGAKGSAIIKEVAQVLFPDIEFLEFLAFQAR